MKKYEVELNFFRNYISNMLTIYIYFFKFEKMAKDLEKLTERYNKRYLNGVRERADLSDSALSCCRWLKRMSEGREGNGVCYEVTRT